MNVFLLGLRVTDSAMVEDGKVNVIAESLPSSNKKISTKVQLIQKEDHYETAVQIIASYFISPFVSWINCSLRKSFPS